MKQMTCAQMGGPTDCTFTTTGNTADEMVKNGFDHIMQAHPDLAKSIQSNPKEVNDKWMEDFKVKFDAAPEM